MKIIIRLIVSALAIWVSAYILPGVHVVGIQALIIMAVVLGAINMFLRPILVILTLPLTLFTLGLFLIIINTLLVLLAAAIVPGFYVDSFWWALLFSLVLAIVHAVLHKMEA